jgi:formylglycine-generating enzyme required for sulfatase activity
MRMAPAYLQRTGYRLPTEAEWEWACRVGARTRWSCGSAEDLVGEYAWHSGNSAQRSHPVGTRKPNDLGMFDMQGNAWEWCQDTHDRYLAHLVLSASAVGVLGTPFGPGSLLAGPALVPASADSFRKHWRGRSHGDPEPVHPEERRMLCGGAFFLRPVGVRSTNRLGNPPTFRADTTGFRPARTVRPTPPDQAR